MSAEVMYDVFYLNKKKQKKTELPLRGLSVGEGVGRSVSMDHKMSKNINFVDSNVIQPVISHAASH